MNVLRIRLQATRLSALLIYVVVMVAAVSLANHRLRTAAEAAPPVAPAETAVDTSQPYFSLSSNRTFGTTENPKLWLDYRGVSSLDFRVYRVNDPARFFAQLSDPHQMGQEEEEQLATTLTHKPSLLERVRALKSWAYNGVRNYFREQLKSETRYKFNQKFRAPDATAKRTPLNVADYARVPLLNPNQLVTSWREPLPALENEYDRRMVPLGKRDPGVYLVEAVGQELRAYTIVVVTDLAMVEKTSPNGELLVYAVDRRTGAPRADTQIELVKGQKPLAAGRTNAEGVFRTKITAQKKDDELGEIDGAEIPEVDNNGYVILASQRENFAISDLDSFYYSEPPAGEQNVGYIYTDRPIYRPTHQVFFKGIMRVLDEQNRYHQPKSQTIAVTIKDPNEARVYEQQLRLSSRGTFHGELTLAEEAPLGVYQIEAITDEGGSTGSFEVAEYKKPEYKVNVTTPQRFVPAGGKSKFEINASYFFGAPVANADVKYYIYRSRYFPSYWESDEYESSSDDEVDVSEYGGYDYDMVSEGEGKLDAAGRLSVDFDVPQANEADVWDSEYRFEAQITDSSRRSINGSARLVATRGSIITTATPDRYVYTPGQTATISVSTTDYEGRPVSSKVTLKFLSRSYEGVEHKENEYDRDYKLVENEISSGEITTDQEGHATYNFPIQTAAGSISIKTVVQQSDRHYTSLGGFIWVANESYADSSYWSYYQEASIKLVPDKQNYRPGETAHVLAILPKEGANLLVTTELDSVMAVRHQHVPGRTVVLDVPIESNYAPNVFLSVTFVQNGDMFTGDQRLIVPARDKLLNLQIIPNKQEYKPRETASYTILARDADGAPVRDAEVSLGVVDEAIYSIQPEYGANIRQQFYGLRYNSVQTRLSIAYWFRGFAGEKPLDLASTKPSYQLADFKNEGDEVQPLIRKEFKDTAYWQPAAVTGPDGRATVKFRLPDNLTTWRATARAVTSDTRVGVTNTKVISRKDVILRLETPRFITQGDTVTLSGIVHNYLKQPKSTHISIDVNGAQLIGPAQKTVTINQQGDHRLDWKVTATQTGPVTLLAKALTNTESDAVQLTLDVVPRGLHETKVERWVTTDETAEQQFSLEIPANADLNSRRLRVEVTPSIAGTLFGALDYLTTFPYGCTEQTMSSFLPNIIVSRTLKEFRSASIRNDNELKAKVESGRNRLYAFQHEDGGWGWWKDDRTDPYMTAYVVNGLSLAQQAGYEIDNDRLARGRGKLQELLDADSNEIDAGTRAFMIYVLAESGGADNRQVEKLFAERQGLQPYARAMLALALSSQKMNERALQVAEEIEQTAHVTQGSAFWQAQGNSHLGWSDRDRTEGTAMSLKALARLKPRSSLLPLAARWLVTERANGYYWNSTKDTAFAIYGLIDYVKVSRELTPSYDLEVYVNGETVVAEHVSDASAARTFLLNRKGSAVGATNQVRIVKRGKGTVYFSSAVEYYTNDENVAARDSSELSVTREYYRLKVEPDGYKLKWSVVPFTGDVHSGDMLVVKLRIKGQPARRLMLEDPIPSGAEQLESVGNLNLDYSEKAWTDWFSAREFRDRRTVFFLDFFDGDATFQYAMRVQVPGEFVVAPARVELMYEPWKNANTATGRFTFLN